MSENEICRLRNVKRDTGENSDAAWLDGAAESGSGSWSGKTTKMADEGNTNCHDMGDNLSKLKLSETDDEEKDKPLASDNGDFSSFLDAGTKYSNKKLFTDPATVTPPASLSELIAELHQIFAHDDVCVEYVQKLMTSYKSNPADWKRFAKFDKYKYTRNLVDEGNGRFNLMILCWNESQGSSIHSHADSHCFLKVLNGEVKEELYHWPDVTSTSNDGTSSDVTDQEKEAAMRKKGDMKFGRDQCTYINDSLGLHRVENESHFNKAVTLHLYSPPFQECSCFDQRSGRATVAKMTFWSKFGKRTPFGKNPEKSEQAVEDN